MGEFIPILSGVVIGALLGLLRPSLRLSLGGSLIVVFGVLATVITGEFRVTWGFLLIDIPLVALSALASFYAVHRIRRASEA
jgi:hypothetical protein